METFTAADDDVAGEIGDVDAVDAVGECAVAVVRGIAAIGADEVAAQGDVAHRVGLTFAIDEDAGVAETGNAQADDFRIAGAVEEDEAVGIVAQVIATQANHHLGVGAGAGGVGGAAGLGGGVDGDAAGDERQAKGLRTDDGGAVRCGGGDVEGDGVMPGQCVGFLEGGAQGAVSQCGGAGAVAGCGVGGIAFVIDGEGGGTGGQGEEAHGGERSKARECVANRHDGFSFVL